MRKGDNESFREYAQKWRYLAAQIQPLLGKREMIDYFLRSRTTPFIKMMTADVYNDFSELVPVREKIEIVYKGGKLGFLKGESSRNGKQKAFAQAKKKEGESTEVKRRKNVDESHMGRIEVSVEKKFVVEEEIAMMRKEDQGFHSFVLKVELVKEKPEDKEASKEDDGVTNVSATSGFTRSGRYNTQKQKKDKGKDIIEGDPMQGRKEKDLDDTIDDDEFLKVLKHSEYNIVDQLKKTLARILLLSLIMSTEVHRKALQKFLDQAYVNRSITVENFDDMVNLIKKVGTIFFTKTNLPVNSSLMQSSSIVVRAFDGTRREVLGDIVLPLEIGLSKFNANFLVIDIEPTYTMLLGRPLIYVTGAISSNIMTSLEDEEPMPMMNMFGEGAGSNPWILLCMKDEKPDNWEMEPVQDLVYFE
ncbi:hypothetical protein L6164_005675 [Bauhinia variegata]|uniref:Uncharacterized protein n=1 Tax=Bauhinia variegata TaxID=167791 RepID=A0ACB9PR34_BAUVA|nr:hypothetical protein L6164_005675 [Bauhinia variegata]